MQYICGYRQNTNGMFCSVFMCFGGRCFQRRNLGMKVKLLLFWVDICLISFLSHKAFLMVYVVFFNVKRRWCIYIDIYM